MKYFLNEFLYHKTLYTLSISFGSVLAYIIEKSILIANSTLFGLSIAIWLMAFAINLYDIYTGIKADTVKQEKLGKKFEFKSNRAWRSVEKIFVFTFIIGFLHFSEGEALRYDFKTLIFIILVVKLSLFFYTVLIEFQSIGENEFERFGKKGKIYQFLDKVIEVVNDGILTRLKRVFD